MDGERRVDRRCCDLHDLAEVSFVETRYVQRRGVPSQTLCLLHMVSSLRHGPDAHFLFQRLQRYVLRPRHVVECGMASRRAKDPTPRYDRRRRGLRVCRRGDVVGRLRYRLCGSVPARRMVGHGFPSLSYDNSRRSSQSLFDFRQCWLHDMLTRDRLTTTLVHPSPRMDMPLLGRSKASFLSLSVVRAHCPLDCPRQRVIRGPLS